MALRRFFIVLFLCCCLTAAAQEGTYRSESIKSAINRLGLAKTADTLRPGLSVLLCRGKQVCIRKNRDNEVVSIGMPLFSKTVRQLQPSPIYDFLEYALLDHTFSISDNPFTYKGFRFAKGSWSELQGVEETMDLNISNIGGSSYQITWSKDGNTVVEVTFPVQYDMLSGSTHSEQEANFIRDLTRYRAHDAVVENVTQKETDNLELRFTNGNVRYYINRGDRLYNENITNDTYYVMDNSRVCSILFDKAYPAETLCNVLVAGTACKQPVALTIMRQDFSKESVGTDAATLASFLKKSGCRNFIGIRCNTDKELAFSVYAENKQAGYTHLIVFNCNPRQALDGQTPLNAKAYLYIPISNIKSLFAEKENR